MQRNRHQQEPSSPPHKQGIALNIFFRGKNAIEKKKIVEPPQSSSASTSPQKKPPVRTAFYYVLDRLFCMKSKTWEKSFDEKRIQQKGGKIAEKKRIFLSSTPARLAFVAVAGFVVIFSLSMAYILRDLPSPRRLTSGENFSVSTQIFDRHGKLLYEVFAGENRTPIKIDTLPAYVYQASIAIEDQNFYSHIGFDITGILRAARNTLERKRLEGGSTITQQLVKYALLSRERSINRKLKEAVLAVTTELLYSKKQILEMYINYISYGGTSVGIESAAHRYFNKPASKLTIAEAAVLAGLPQSPTRFSPFGPTPEDAKKRQLEVLRRMREDNYITKAQEDSAAHEALQYAVSRTDIQAPHFVFYVRDLLYAKYGVDRVEKGGLRVTTSLDLDLQNVAQASLSAEITRLQGYRVGNGAGMVIKPDTGEILSMIGSKDYFDTSEDGQVNVTLAERQPGSSIKPLMYATAFQKKLLNPGTYFIDNPVCFLSQGQKPYCPKNYDGRFHGLVTVRQALGNSLNIPAVKALRTIGVPQFIEQAAKLGITTWTNPANYGLSLTLGGGEVRMIDLAQSFSSLANEGVKVPLTPILRVEDYKGNVIDTVDLDERKKDLKSLTQDEEIPNKGELQRVMNRAPAYLVGHIMQDNKAREADFGPHSKLVIPNQIVSAKTGTTNDFKDNWTVGFTPEYLTIAWVGNNNGTAMNSSLVSGITGAAPIWNDIMSYVLRNQFPLAQEKPPDVQFAQVCVSGFPPLNGDTCTPKDQELYWLQSQPSQSSMENKQVWIHPDSNLPLISGESTNGLTLQQKTLFSDPVTPQFCLDCVRPAGPNSQPSYEQQNVSSVPSPSPEPSVAPTKK